MQVTAAALCLCSFALLCMAKSASSATISTHCGGVLEVSVESPAQINYKLNEEYDNNEQCVWTIRLRDTHAAIFTKVESNFELRYDFLQVSSFRDNNLLLPAESRILGNVNEEETFGMEAPVIFVVFSSDDSNTGTGFSLEIQAFYPDPWNYRATDFFTDEPIGNVSLRAYEHRTFSTWVFTANQADSLDLGIIYNTESYFESILVFHVERNGGRIIFFPYGILSGEGSRHFTIRFYTTFVVIFNTGTIGSVGYGIDFDWRANYDGSGTEKP